MVVGFSFFKSYRFSLVIFYIDYIEYSYCREKRSIYRLILILSKYIYIIQGKLIKIFRVGRMLRGRGVRVAGRHGPPGPPSYPSAIGGAMAPLAPPLATPLSLT